MHANTFDICDMIIAGYTYMLYRLFMLINPALEFMFTIVVNKT